MIYRIASIHYRATGWAYTGSLDILASPYIHVYRGIRIQGLYTEEWYKGLLLYRVSIYTVYYTGSLDILASLYTFTEEEGYTAGLVCRGMIYMVASIQGEQYHIQGRSTYSQAYTEEEGLHNLYTMYILYRGWIYRVASKQGKYTGWWYKGSLDILASLYTYTEE